MCFFASFSFSVSLYVLHTPVILAFEKLRRVFNANTGYKFSASAKELYPNALVLKQQ